MLTYLETKAAESREIECLCSSLSYKNTGSGGLSSLTLCSYNCKINNTCFINGWFLWVSFSRFLFLTVLPHAYPEIICIYFMFCVLTFINDSNMINKVSVEIKS